MAIGVLAFAVILAIGALHFSAAKADRAISHTRCERIGGVWRADVVGHGAHCERTVP
jgi:hypothetical protein